MISHRWKIRAAARRRAEIVGTFAKTSVGARARARATVSHGYRFYDNNNDREEGRASSLLNTSARSGALFSFFRRLARLCDSVAARLTFGSVGGRKKDGHGGSDESGEERKRKIKRARSEEDEEEKEETEGVRKRERERKRSKGTSLSVDGGRR